MGRAGKWDFYGLDYLQKKHINSYTGARYKSFLTREVADAAFGGCEVNLGIFC